MGSMTTKEKILGAALLCAALAGCDKELTEESGEILLRSENIRVVSQPIAPDVRGENGRLGFRNCF